MSERALTTARGGTLFYVAMAAAMAITVAVGFGPTFYLVPALGGAALSPLVIVHGFVFTGWMLLLLAQTMLAATGRLDLHRRLGVAGAVLAAVMLVVGLMTAIAAAAAGHAPPGAPPPLSFLVIPFFAIVLFALLVGAAILFRHDGETHKRLMILATVSIVTAATARLPLPIAVTPPIFFALTDLFIVVGVVRDLRRRGRVHPAYLWGGLLVVVSQPVQLAFAGTETWIAFARWLTT